MRQIIALWLAALMLAAQPLQAAVCVGFGQSASSPSIADTFDTNTSANYDIMIGSGTLAVTGGYLYQSNNTYVWSFWNHETDLTTTDQHVSGTIDNVTSDPVGLTFKVTPASDTFYFVYFTSAGYLRLLGRNGGSWGSTEIYSGGTYSTGARLVDITTSGTSVTVKVDGATAISGTLADGFTGTYVGVGAYRGVTGNKIYDFNAEAN